MWENLENISVIWKYIVYVHAGKIEIDCQSEKVNRRIKEFAST